MFYSLKKNHKHFFCIGINKKKRIEAVEGRNIHVRDRKVFLAQNKIKIVVICVDKRKRKKGKSCSGETFGKLLLISMFFLLLFNFLAAFHFIHQYFMYRRWKSTRQTRKASEDYFLEAREVEKMRKGN